MSPIGRRIIAHGESRGSVEEHDEPRRGVSNRARALPPPTGLNHFRTVPTACAVGYDLPLLPELAYVNSIVPNLRQVWQARG